MSLVLFLKRFLPIAFFSSPGTRSPTGAYYASFPNPFALSFSPFLVFFPIPKKSTRKNYEEGQEISRLQEQAANNGSFLNISVSTKFLKKKVFFDAGSSVCRSKIKNKGCFP